MRRLITLFFIFAIGTIVCPAQQQKCLKEIKSSSNYHYTYYGYKGNLVDSIYQKSNINGSEYYRILEYNDKGENIGQYEYSREIGMYSFVLTNKTFYTYDEQGNITTCENYILDTDENNGNFLFAGTFVYEYDFDGRLVTSTLYNDEELSDPLEVMEYTYNEMEKLDYVRHYSIQFGDYIEDYGEAYAYDQERLDQITFLTVDFMSGLLTEGMYRKFIYDVNGNLISKVDMSSDKVITEKHDFKYDLSEVASETVFPINNMDDKMLYTESKNIVSEELIYYRNAGEDRLELADTDMWLYEDIDVSGIKNVNSAPSLNIEALSDDMIVLSNVENGKLYRIYNDNGRCMGSAVYNNGIDISALPGGVYLLSTGRSTTKFRK